jgi:chromosome segregation ATPase
LDKQIHDKDKKIRDQSVKIDNLSKEKQDSENDRRELNRQISKYLKDIEDLKSNIQEKNDSEL